MYRGINGMLLETVFDKFWYNKRVTNESDPVQNDWKNMLGLKQGKGLKFYQKKMREIFSFSVVQMSVAALLFLSTGW